MIAPNYEWNLLRNREQECLGLILNAVGMVIELNRINHSVSLLLYSSRRRRLSIVV